MTNLAFGKTESQFSDKIENIVGKGENAGYQHVLLFSQGLQNHFSQVCEI